MATKTIHTIFKFRRKNASEWPANYLLREGEPGFELDTGKLKIGDGHTLWSELEYLSGSGSIGATGGLEITTNNNQSNITLQGFTSALAGSIPSKTDNNTLIWINPLNENDIINSTSINTWIEEKIEKVTSYTYCGEASLVSENNGIITIYDKDFNAINNASIGDIYSYTINNITKRYLWDGSQWIELYGQELYATKTYVNNAINNIENIDVSKLSQTTTYLLFDCGNAESTLYTNEPE